MSISAYRAHSLKTGIGILIALGLTISAVPAFGGTGVYQYYVSTTGSNNYGNGSQLHPWRTITFASSHIGLGPSGTIVHVAPGTYYGDVRTYANGTASARVRYVSD